MLPTSAGVEPATSWSPVGRRIQLSHRGRPMSNNYCPVSKRKSKKFLFTYPRTWTSYFQLRRVSRLWDTYFSYLWNKTYVVSTNKKCLTEVLLMSTYNICFSLRNKKMSIFRQVNLGWTNRFWPFTCLWRIEFGNSTALPKVNSGSILMNINPCPTE